MHLTAQSPYINKVYDYVPAPGQFVNELPEYKPGDAQADMNRKVEEEIAGANHNRGMITLGGYGGYIVFGFDHEVENVAGKYDFRILGNAFYADANPNGEASHEGGSCEPGIVMVSRDANNNGLPDDPWYELAGSDYNRPQTIHNYRITYARPNENKERVPHPSEHHVNDMEYVRWTTNGHGDGYVYRNTYHDQPYYPLWIADETLTFEGTKLADNYVDESGQGTYYVLYAMHWGYADNQPNNDNRSGFNIEWAVDANRQPVQLPGIHFVKVYTAVNQNCGWIGETSTEIAGAEDLHLTGRDEFVPVFVSGIAINRSSAEIRQGETLRLSATLTPADATNQAITWRSMAEEVATVDAAGLVTARAGGLARIQAISNDGYHIATCEVTVTASSTPSPTPTPDPGRVAVNGIYLNHNSVALFPGEMLTLFAEVKPSDATNKDFEWSSSDPQVADVTVNGLVIAESLGTATITATTIDGAYRASCTVTVRSNTSGAGSVTSDEPKVYYANGQLHLFQLEGYDCELVSVAGQGLQRFRISSQVDSRPLRLPSGMYILTAQKGNSRKIFKFMMNLSSR
jgi:hypothetical protein